MPSLIPTPHGDARAHLARPADDPVGLIMLGHGAGGGVTAHDLRLGTEVALAAGLAVAQVEQPYRVAGRQAPAPPAEVDAVWLRRPVAACRWTLLRHPGRMPDGR